MVKIIGVQFQKNGKLYYFDPNGLETSVGDYVIVDTARGQDLGEIVMGCREINEESWTAPLKKLIRIATEQDIQHSRDNRSKEKEAFSICQKKIAEHKLEMKLVSVEYAFDNSKILFFFTANGRVDFRSLVKDLASIFKMRIELRQIGVRDEAKILGGLGPCGRSICCGTFLDQFQPVSIKMAKEQNLSLNPTKISGVCGRLMCCLKYEQDNYEQARKKMPKVGKEVSTPDGTGPVTDLNIVKETVFVRLTNGDSSEIREYPLDSITRLAEPASRNESENKRKNDREMNEPVQGRKERSPEKAAAKASGKASGPANGLSDEEIDPSDQSSSKNKQKLRRGNVLGQPVKRENPNRLNPPIQETAPSKAPEPAEPPAVQHSGSAWADAVQKAMNAIEQEK